MTADSVTVQAFLARAAAEFEAGGWIFTGFNWPVLAARTARRLGTDFVQTLEAGAALHSDTTELMTSTTDHFLTAPVTCWRGSLAEVVTSIVPRCTRVLIDAANVDIRGRTNSSAIGNWRSPKVRLPGGGGGPDVAVNARHLVLLHGGDQVERIVEAVTPITAAPGPDTRVELVTRWGRVRLGDDPRLLTVVDDDASSDFVSHLERIGVDTRSAGTEADLPATALEAAVHVLSEARARGYAVPAVRS